MCGKLQHFFFQARGSFEQGGADVDGAAAAKRAAAELYRRGITFDEANIFRAHSPKISGDLGENGFMTLAMAGRAGRNDDLTGGINAHLRALERTHAGPLHVTADADTKVS